MRRSGLAILVAVLGAGVLATAAHADGDPASDYLFSQSVFLPPDAGASPIQSEQLSALVADSKRRGFPIRVAVVATPYDLGSVGSLFRKPQRYAAFLAQEIVAYYKDTLLIVMPNGYGVARGATVPAPDRKRLDALPPPGGAGPGLVNAVAQAVTTLAAARGVHPTADAVESGRSGPPWLLAGAVTGGALVLAAAAFVAVRRRRRAATP